MNRKPFKYVLFTLVWLMFTSELIVRTTLFESLKTRHPQANWVQDPVFGALPEPESVFRLVEENVNKEIQINKYGLYDPGMRLIKPQGYYRIAYVGNISETGYFSNSSGSWTDHCRQMFDEEDAKVEFINFSLQFPRDDYRNILLIREKIIKFMPDLVILSASLPFNYHKTAKEQYNGFLIEYDSDSCKMALMDNIKIVIKDPLPKLLNASYILRSISRYKNSNPSGLWYGMNVNRTRFISGGIPEPEIYSLSESMLIINQLSEELLEQGISLCLLTPENIDVNGLNPNIGILSSDVLDSCAEVCYNKPAKIRVKDTREMASEIHAILKGFIIPDEYTITGT